jgi:HEPN domain-containing protein
MKRDEWQRYRRQAEHTLDSARRDMQAGDHDWACFKAQQSAEIALKGYLRASQEYVTGHSVVKLLGMLDPAVAEDLFACARELDKTYIPARDRMRGKDTRCPA